MKDWMLPGAAALGGLTSALVLHAPNAHADPNDIYLNCLSQHGVVVDRQGMGAMDSNLYIAASIQQQLGQGVPMPTIVARLVQLGQTQARATAETICAAQTMANQGKP
jgi:hypothetical protein